MTMITGDSVPAIKIETPSSAFLFDPFRQRYLFLYLIPEFFEMEFIHLLGEEPAAPCTPVDPVDNGQDNGNGSFRGETVISSRRVSVTSPPAANHNKVMLA